MLAANSPYLRWLNILAFISMILVNGLAGSTTIIGGKNAAQISDDNPSLITPAGYVFSIWGIIYVTLGIFVVLQALPRERGKDYQERIGWFFILSSLLNITWIFLWHHEFLSLSVLIMFMLLVTLAIIYLRLDIGRSSASLREKLVIHLPFSIYLGWITIASIENVTVALVSVSWNGFGISPISWATLIMIVALLIALLVIATRRDLAYGLVIIWALVGIMVEQSGNQNIVMIAGISVIIVAVAEVAIILLNRLARATTTTPLSQQSAY